MSYSLYFVDYYQPNSPDTYFDLSDIESMEKDPISINSVDFNKAESRKCKLKLYAYDWIVNTFFDDSSFIDIDDRVAINKYAIRIEENGQTDFIGWLTLSDYSYDKKEEIVTLTLTDSLGILIKLSDKTIEYETQTTIDHKDFIVSLLEESGWEDAFTDYYPDDIDYSLDYSYNVGVEITDIPIPITDSDINEGIGVDVSDWLNITKIEGGMWGWGMSGDYDYNYIQENGTWEERYWINIEYLGNQQFNIWIQKHGRGDYPRYSYTYRYERIMWLKLKVEISGLNFILLESVAGKRSNTEIAEMTPDWHPLWDDYSIFNNFGPDNPQVNWVTVTTYAYDPTNTYIIDGDPPFVMGDNLEITYNSLLTLSEITIKEGEYTIKELLNAALFTNALAIYTERDSDLIIENKFENNSSVIPILDSDIIEYSLEGIVKSPLKIKNKMSPLYFSDLQENILVEVEEYYNDMLPNNLLKLKIMNNYDLGIFNQIQVYGENYTINSISIDNDNQIYTVEAWR